MMIKFSDIVSNLEQWAADKVESRAVILRGANGVFCSGGDLNFMSKIADPISGSKMCLFMQNANFRLSQLPLLTVALIEGHAIGGGAELTMSCDWRLITASGKIGFVQGSLGISPGWGGGTFLTRRVGYKSALEILSSASLYSAVQAKQLGLVDEILNVDNPENSEVCLGEAKMFLNKFTQTVYPKAGKVLKKLALRSSDFAVSIQDALRYERDLFVDIWGSPDHIAALNNIKSKK